MGFGKFLLGGICVAGAVIAAPVVLPAAAAVAGSAAAAATAATAVAASTAVGAATAATAAVASTAAGVATAATAAVASTAVGGAVLGTAGAAMGVVGSAVGTAAGTVGLTSVATVAGTATGATAVGTITTAGAVGAASTISGVGKMTSAKDLVNDSRKRYDDAKTEFEIENNLTTNTLQNLGRVKLEISESFNDFYITISKIKNCTIVSNTPVNEKINISIEELNEIKQIAITALDLAKTSAGSVGAGALAGVAAYGGTMALGTASTGTAIATLSGAAATNATMAALGGGALSAGGLGMAGGSIVLGGIAAAPALAVGGLFLNAKGNDSMEKAEKVKRVADQAIKSLNDGAFRLVDIGKTAEEIKQALLRISGQYKDYLKLLNDITDTETDFAKFTEEQKNITEKCVLSVIFLKNIIKTPLLISKGDEQIINKEEVVKVLHDSITTEN